MSLTIHDAIPHLRLQGAAQAIDFYTRAFGAVEQFRLTEPGEARRIGHAEIRIGGATIMLADEYPEYGIRGPKTIGGTTFAINLRANDVDALMEQAVQAGATVVRPLENQFYGERSGTIRDPFGHEWTLGQEIEKVPPEEMQRRFLALFPTQ